MKDILNKLSDEMLKEYYYECRGQYPPTEFSRQTIIDILMKQYNK